MGLTDKNLYAYCDNNPITRADNGGAYWDIIWDVISLGFGVADVVNNPDDVWAWVGLAADVVDLIPFVTFLGEGVRAVRTSIKVADTVVDVADTVHDVDTTIYVLETANDARKVGWKVGDDISNLTKAGNEPSWTTVRQRYWKNQAFCENPLYNEEDFVRMRKGLAPIRDGAPMELHHTFGRKGYNFYVFEPLTKSQHHFIHYGW